MNERILEMIAALASTLTEDDFPVCWFDEQGRFFVGRYDDPRLDYLRADDEREDRRAG
jgi:hypothetical protein